MIGAMSEFVWTKASCLGSVGPKNQKLACSGSAVIHHKFKEAKKQVTRRHKDKLNAELVKSFFGIMYDKIDVNL